MKHLYIALLASAALTTACSDYNDQFEGLKEGHHAVDIKKKDYTLTADDYEEIAENSANMALAKKNGEEKELAELAITKQFTEKITSQEYLPSFLAKKWFTAENGSVIKVTFNHITEQYVLKSNKWVQEPSMFLDLTVNSASVKAFYQAVVTWVQANKDAKYVDPLHRTTEYYSGASSSQKKIDLRVSEAKRVVPELAQMKDEDIQKQLLKNLSESFAGALAWTYPYAMPVEGVDAVFTLKFSTNEGRNSKKYEVKFKVVGKGQFELIAKSLKELK